MNQFGGYMNMTPYDFVDYVIQSNLRKYNLMQKLILKTIQNNWKPGDL